MDIGIVINTADQGALEVLRESIRQLRDQGHRVEPRITFEAGDGALFAADARRRGVDMVVAAGGDGTINEVVNGLVDPADGGDKVPRLGIIPLGTANDFAGYLSLPTDIEAALLAAVDAPGLKIDVGVVNDRRFLNVSSGGLGAEATEEASDAAKKLLGSVAYFVTGVRKFAALQPSHGSFVSGGATLFEGDFLFFAVGNGARTGGGNWVTPNADLTDGRLDLCIVEAMSHADLLKLLPNLRSGGHLDHPGVVYRQLREVEIGIDGDFSVNVDGEPIEEAPLNYSVIPEALELATPRPTKLGDRS